MSASTFYRFSGGALLVGGVLSIVGQFLLLPVEPGSPQWIPAALLALGGLLLVILGWPGLYIRQIQRAGSLGMLGFVLSQLAFVIVAGVSTVDAFVSPVLAANAATRSLLDEQAFLGLLMVELIGGLLLVVGPVLFGIATIRAGLIPRWIAILFVVGAVATLVTVILHNWNEISAAILFLAIACFGAALWSNQDAAAEIPSPSVLKEAHS